MSNPNDATINIPMNNVSNSKTGARKTDAYNPATTGTPEQQLNEKLASTNVMSLADGERRERLRRGALMGRKRLLRRWA